MQSNSVFHSRIYLIFFVTMLVTVCFCDSHRTKKFRTKVKRKVESFNYGNKIPENERAVKNSTEKESERGFLPGEYPPLGSIFSLGKVLNFFPVGGERECQPTKGFTVARSGICLNPYDCRQRDGKAGGDCAHGLGVCCVFEVTCGGRVQNNLTYFMSPGFPELWRGQRECSITVDKAHAGIMQLRLDFVHFSIGQPNRTTGKCDEDVMTLGDGANQFKMCGQNHGQHLYYTLSTDAETREADEDFAGDKQTRLSITAKGPNMPRLWLLRLAQMPLANSAPHDCLQYFTEPNGTISTFNYAINGRYLAGHEYRACVRRNTGYCAVRYSPCDERSFRIGTASGAQTYTADSYIYGPGEAGGPGTGFYGPDGQFIPGQTPLAPQASTIAPVAAMADQLVTDTQNDPVIDDGMIPAMPPDQSQTQQDEVEGSGDDPQMAPAVAPTVPVPSIASRIWSYIWPSWLWGQGSRRSKARTWGFWSPYSQHYLSKEDDQFLYQGYGNFGIDFRGFGRQRCQDRVTIPCDNEYLISNTPFISGVCDPHHCGQSFCPGMPFSKCHVQSSVSPFAVSVHFGPPSSKGSPEENIGACLNYQQLPCNL